MSRTARLRFGQVHSGRSALNIEEAIRLYLTPTDLDLPEHAKLVEFMVG